MHFCFPFPSANLMNNIVYQDKASACTALSKQYSFRQHLHFSNETKWPANSSDVIQFGYVTLVIFCRLR